MIDPVKIQPVVLPTTVTKYCKHCNMKFAEWVTYCQFCGRELKRIKGEVVTK